MQLIRRKGLPDFRERFQGACRARRQPCRRGHKELSARRSSSFGQRRYGRRVVSEHAGSGYFEENDLGFGQGVRQEGGDREERDSSRIAPFLCHPFADGGCGRSGGPGNVGPCGRGTTQIYTQVEAERLLDEHANFHPLSRSAG